MSRKLITCRYGPGDTVIETGEKEEVLHLVIKGVARVEASSHGYSPPFRTSKAPFQDIIGSFTKTS